MDNNERREILKQTLVEINASLLSNSHILDKAILSLSSAGLGVSLAFIKNVVPLDKATNLYILYLSWGTFVGAIAGTLVSFLASQFGLEKQANQVNDELENMDDEQVIILPEGADDNKCEEDYEETDPSDRSFQVSKWLTRFSLGCYIAAIIFTVFFIACNRDVISTKPN